MINLMRGDCLELMKTIPDGGVDLTVTSPPYDNLRTYGGTLDWNEDIWKSVISELYRVTNDGGVVVWVVGDATIKGSETGTSFRQALYFKEIGFNLHDTMIWEKSTFSAVGALKTRYAPVFEYMFIMVKGKLNTFNPIKDKKNKHFGVKHHGTYRNTDGTTKEVVGKSKGKVVSEFGQRHNVWQINEEKVLNKIHPAVFPESLANDHIISWSNENDIVFDPFMGSGTTGKMAILNNRNFIGIEKVEEYFNIAEQRVQEAINKKGIIMRCKCCNDKLEAFDDFTLCKKCIRKSEDTSTTWKDPQHILITNVRSGSMRDGGVISPQRKGCD